MMRMIDINADLGESFGAYTLGRDEELLNCVTSANIACGFHAGDPVVMSRTVRLSAKAGVLIGAHPGYPDLQGFGRRRLEMSPDEVKAAVLYQIGALAAIARAEGISLHHVKPHGALYNAAARDEALSRAIVEAVQAAGEGLILYAPYGSETLRLARAAGLRAWSEVFADRAYQPDGTLVPRSRPGAVLQDEDEVATRVRQMVTEGSVIAADGTVIPLEADTVCVHGDSPAAVRLARRIREAIT